MSATWAGLAAALSAVPKLDGAACWGRWDLFDPEADREHGQQSEDPHDRHQLAVSICLTECPCLDACRSYVESLRPSQRPIGAIAGSVRYQRKRQAA